VDVNSIPSKQLHEKVYGVAVNIYPAEEYLKQGYDNWSNIFDDPLPEKFDIMFDKNSLRSEWPNSFDVTELSHTYIDIAIASRDE
jgi:hypothetical protein